MTARVRRVRGKRVCATVHDGKGRAHLLSPTWPGATVCGRQLELAGQASGKSCQGCAEGAAAANVALRALIPW